MKPNVIIALLVGLGLGFAIGKVVSGPSAPSTISAGGGAESEAAFALKSSDMPAGTFTGMSDAQKYAVMKVMNDNTCDCGCDKGTLANCVKTDPNCPNSPAKLKQAVELAKQGKSAPDIQTAMFGGPGKAAPTAARPAPKADDSQTVYKVPLENAPVKGKADALVTIVEFTDYECPFCARGEKTMQDLQKDSDYGKKIRFAMKQNPLSFHPNAKPAAVAALAAGEQGKYWEMHEKLFADQKSLTADTFEKYAKEIGLNVPKWKEALKNPKHEQTIQKDQALAAQLGATGTPAFFINGRKVSGAQPIDNFKRLIDEEYKKAEALVSGGTKPADVYAKVMESGVSAPPAAPAAPAAAAAGGVKKIEAPADSPSFGPKNAKVTIVEWSDFQCPFCARALPALKEIKEKYPKDVRVVFRHQPLPFHQNAQISAEASMAAHEQGKFWEMHDKMFANAQALDRASLDKYAKELGLDVNKFKQALDSGKFKAKVKADADNGMAVGANGTPTFFINGRELVGAQPFPAFKTIIDEDIAKADKLLAAGTKPEQLYEKLLAQGAAAAPAADPHGDHGAPAPGGVANINVGQAPVKGPQDAPVTIVAWSDFECPFCSRVVPTLKQIEEQYKGKVRMAFKHQPLPFHQNARLAASASMAANEQGKFWEMHDKLFANQRALDRASLEKYAQELGLNLAKFKQALDSNKYDSLISADSSEGSKLGANGTPTFFINGRQLVGAQPFDSFKTIIDEELNKVARK